MKKIFTLLASAMMAVAASAQVAPAPIIPGTGGGGGMVTPIGAPENTTLAYYADAGANKLSGEALGAAEGWSLQITGNETKNLTAGGGSFTVPYFFSEAKTIKLSNGAQNTVTLPEGRYAVRVMIFATINKDDASGRVCYWKEVNGVTYEAPLAEGETPEEGKLYGQVINSYKDYENPNLQVFTLPNVNSFTFTNTGEQPMVVLVVQHTDQPSSIVEVAADENAPVEYYNLQGVRVENPVNGLFIRKQGSKVTKVVL